MQYCSNCIFFGTFINTCNTFCRRQFMEIALKDDLLLFDRNVHPRIWCFLNQILFLRKCLTAARNYHFLNTAPTSIRLSTMK